MKTAQADIRSLLQRVEAGELRLPEIQRGYIWKPAQIAGLIDSLYRRYPSGSLLLWETDVSVSEREAAINGPHGKPITKPQYILDGQQRLTSLHRVLTGHEKARVVFNVQTERFQIESAATKKDIRWVGVHEVLTGNTNLYQLVQQLDQKLPDVGGGEIHSRLERLKKTLDYLYYIEIVEGLPYEEVTEIFVRVNSKGRPLTKVDLALATISARWRGVISKLETESDRLQDQGYGHLGVSFLTRCLAATATDSATLQGFTTVPVKDLEAGWESVKRGLSHLVPLLQENARIATSDLLPSVNALVPLVVFLGVRPDQALSAEDAKALIYWLFGVFLVARYSGSSQTVMAQDSLAARREDPLPNLYRNAGIRDERLAVTEEALVGRGANSPYFLFSYLAAVNNKANDWYYGTEISTRLKESQKLEYHHIHPRATLRDYHARAEINDLANYAFISGKANRKISHRPPSDYFAEIGEENLHQHFVPLETELRKTSSYREFLQARRQLLAEAMTKMLDEFRPKSVSLKATTVLDPTVGESLNIAIYAARRDDPDGVVVLTAATKAEHWQGEIPLPDLLRFVSELQAGLGSDITVGGDTISVLASADEIDLPIGPLAVMGSWEEWNKILDRELGDLQDPNQRPPLSAPVEWTGERVRFPILESD